MFAIVEFEEEDSVAVVPTSWLSAEDGTAFWPPLPKNATRLAAKNVSPATNWEKFTARVIKKFGKNTKTILFMKLLAVLMPSDDMKCFCALESFNCTASPL